jgi:AraC-like DNA-binding protein
MARKPKGEPTTMEQHAIERIRRMRALRASLMEGRGYTRLEERAELMHDILRGLHGHAKLRLEVISRALGSSMKTLERKFRARYGESMTGFHRRTRLEIAERMIILDPDVKLMSIASSLGYDRESEFNRFYKRQRGITPSEFARAVRDRQKKGDFTDENLPGRNRT